MRRNLRQWEQLADDDDGDDDDDDNDNNDNNKDDNNNNYDDDDTADEVTQNKNKIKSLSLFDQKQNVNNKKCDLHSIQLPILTTRESSIQFFRASFCSKATFIYYLAIQTQGQQWWQLKW